MNRVMIWHEYSTCVHDCIEMIKSILKENQELITPHIITLYRGGLILGVSLSNKLSAPLSIIDFQSYDGDSKAPVFMKEVRVKESELLVIVDDIADSGNSLRKTIKLVKEKYPKNKIFIYTLVGDEKHPKSWNYTIEHNESWHTFPWE